MLRPGYLLPAANVHGDTSAQTFSAPHAAGPRWSHLNHCEPGRRARECGCPVSVSVRVSTRVRAATAGDTGSPQPSFSPPMTGPSRWPTPGPGTAYTVTMESGGVTLSFLGGDGGTLRLFGEPAANGALSRLPTISSRAPSPMRPPPLELPNATVGYQPGYGEFADVFPKALRSATSGCAWWSSSPRRTGQR